MKRSYVRHTSLKILRILCKRYLIPVLAYTVLSCIFAPVSVFANDDAGSYRDGVLPGARNEMPTEPPNKGIDTEIVYKLDVISNRSGGKGIGTRVLDNLDVKFNLDGEKLFNSKGTSAKIYFLHNNGGAPGAAMVGDSEGIDNIEVTTPTGRLYEAWIQQNSMEDQLSFLAGLHDLNSEFYVTDTSGIFLRPTFGIGTDMGQSGRNGPSIFPVTSACVRVKVQPSPKYFIQVAAFDGVPGDPNNPRGTHIDLRRGDGDLLVGETDYMLGEKSTNGKIGIGAWKYTRKVDDLVDVDASGNPIKRRSDGMYVLGERQIYQVSGHDDQGLKIFARYGIANGDVVQFDYAWSAGVVYTGLVPGRDKGQLGLGVEGAHTSNKYRKAVGSADASETAYELTYSDNLTPWLAIQPDIQYIVNPSADPALKNAMVVGTRLTIIF